jgi:hypothetical protein
MSTVALMQVIGKLSYRDSENERAYRYDSDYA